MNEHYKILEFKGKVTGAIFKSNEYNNFKTNLPNSSSYSEKEMLFDNAGSVKSGDFSIIKVQKTNGEILEIKDKVYNIKSKKYYIIDRFALREKEIVIYYDQGDGYLTIGNSNLVNQKAPIQKEIEFKEPVEGYTLEQIEQVLSKALDKPEVEALIIDFKKLKVNNDVVAPEEVKVTLKHEPGRLMYYEDDPMPKAKLHVFDSPVKGLNSDEIKSPLVRPVPTSNAWINKSDWDMLHGSQKLELHEKMQKRAMIDEQSWYDEMHKREQEEQREINSRVPF